MAPPKSPRPKPIEETPPVEAQPIRSKPVDETLRLEDQAFGDVRARKQAQNLRVGEWPVDRFGPKGELGERLCLLWDARFVGEQTAKVLEDIARLTGEQEIEQDRIRAAAERARTAEMERREEKEEEKAEEIPNVDKVCAAKIRFEPIGSICIPSFLAPAPVFDPELGTHTAPAPVQLRGAAAAERLDFDDCSRMEEQPVLHPELEEVGSDDGRYPVWVSGEGKMENSMQHPPQEAISSSTDPGASIRQTANTWKIGDPGPLMHPELRARENHRSLRHGDDGRAEKAIRHTKIANRVQHTPHESTTPTHPASSIPQKAHDRKSGDRSEWSHPQLQSGENRAPFDPGDGRAPKRTIANRMQHTPQQSETRFIDPRASTRAMSSGWSGDPHQTVHPYMGKLNESGPKYGNWRPHPHLCDMDTLTKTFGSWSGAHRLEVEPQVNAGNLRGERLRLGWGGGVEHGQVLYPPVGLCNPHSAVPTQHPGHWCKVDFHPENTTPCPYSIAISSPNPAWPTSSRPHMPCYTTQASKPEHRPVPHVLKPDMPTAGVPTLNNCPLSYRNHPAVVRDPQSREIVVGKTMGQFVNPNFGPEPGDIAIWQQKRHRNGFVSFCRAADKAADAWRQGDQIVRLGRLRGGEWVVGCEFKMFKLIAGTRWMITGLLDFQDARRELVPVGKNDGYRVGATVAGFWPRRGDLLVTADATGHASQLHWAVVPVTGPAFKPGAGDVVLRAFMWRPRTGPGVIAGRAQMFVFDGVGMGWVFIGADECLLDKCGVDLLGQLHREGREFTHKCPP